MQVPELAAHRKAFYLGSILPDCNSTYDGNLKDHCYYEKALKFRLREYVKSDEVLQEQIEVPHFSTAEAVVNFIRNAHREYLSRKRNVEEDCRYIVRICRQVVQAILSLAGCRVQTGLCVA